MQTKRYLVTYSLTMIALAALFVLMLGGAWIFLKRTGELSLDRVVEKQAAGEFCLFGSAVDQDNFTYKLALYQRCQPNIVVLGSSRVMQMRGRYFKDKFLNMGGSVGSIASLEAVLNRMFESGHTPKLVLLGLDFWWFNPNHDSARQNFTAPDGSYDITWDRLKLPFSWLIEKKITLLDFFNVIMDSEKYVRQSSRLGIMAWKLGDGFGPDGSYYYTSYITGKRPPEDPRFSDTLNRIARRNARFESGAALSVDMITRLKKQVDRLQEKGVKVVLFMPPLASPPYKALLEAGEDYGFLIALPGTLRSAGLKVYDYTNPESVGTSDCEFLDGFHGGEVSYTRILDSICQHEDAVRDVIYSDEVKAALLSTRGLAMVPDARVTTSREQDFLTLGCNKVR